jgi:Protein of unknown function (DUF3093)
VSTTPAYAERLGVPLRWWVQGTMLVATLWLAVAVAAPAPVAWLVTAVALTLLVFCLWSYGNARIVVGGGSLRAGRAHIEARHLGTATPLDAEQTRRAAGADADARAFLLLRPYLKRAVKVAITDPADPAPYWLLSTRHPEELARALTALAHVN